MKFRFMLSVAVLAGAPFGSTAWAATADTAAADTASEAPPADAAPPIIVTATPFSHHADETPAISARVNADQIRQAGGASIADALRDVPGVSATGFASGASRPIIRGMDANRVRLLEDGTSSSDVSDIGPDHGIPIDPLAARSIEVVRGAATLRYGSQAVGGVVNTLNNRVPMALPEQSLSFEASGGYTSVNEGGEGAALVDGKLGQVALHADGFYRRTGNYDTPQGQQANSFFHGLGGSLGGSYFLGDGKSHVGLALTHYEAQYGIPSDITYIDMRQTKLISRNAFVVDQGLLKTVTLDGSYGDYAHDEKNPDGSINTTFKNKEANVRAEVLLNKIGPVDHTALGVEYQHRSFQAIGADSSYLQPATSRNLAGYVFAEVELAQHLHMEASGRVENVAVTGTPASGVFTSRSYTPISGALGLLYAAAPGIKLGLNASSTGRAPALSEMFAHGGHDGPQTYETGSPDLKIERGNSLEASLRAKRGIVRFEGSLYSTWYTNYIYGDMTGRSCDDDGVCEVGTGGDLREVIYRQQGAHFRGAEAEANVQLFSQGSGTLSAKLLGDYTRATLDNGHNVPRIPPYRLGGGLSWQSAKVDAGISLSHYGRQTDFGDYDTATPAYNALSAQVALRPFKAWPGAEIAVIGQNLTNDVQRLATSFNKDMVMMPGRSVRVVLKIASL